MSVDATVCMPWRAAPERLPAQRRCVAFWEHHGFPVITSDSEPGPFHVGQARNNAVRQATSEWVIIADADCIPDIASIYRGFDYPMGLTWPTDDFRYIPADWAERSDLMAAPVQMRWRGATGGVMMARREVFWVLGGYDETFDPVWGFEDAAIHLAALTLSVIRHLPGIVFSFNHGGERDESPANPNYHHHQKYVHARGNPHAMRRLIRRR